MDRNLTMEEEFTDFMRPTTKDPMTRSKTGVMSGAKLGFGKVKPIKDPFGGAAGGMEQEED